MNQYFIWAASWLHVHFRSRYSGPACLLVSLLHQHSFMVWTAAERAPRSPRRATIRRGTLLLQASPPNYPTNGANWNDPHCSRTERRRRELLDGSGGVLGVRSDPGLFQTTRSWHAAGSCGLFQVSVEHLNHVTLFWGDTSTVRDTNIILFINLKERSPLLVVKFCLYNSTGERFQSFFMNLIPKKCQNKLFYLLWPLRWMV